MEGLIFGILRYYIFKVRMCQYGDANSSSNWRWQKSFFMNPPGSVEDLKKLHFA